MLNFLALLTILNPFHLSASEQATLQLWAPSQFTIPSDLPPHFKFVFHSLSLTQDRGGFDLSDRALQLLKDPNSISDNPKISASLIDENHRGVFTLQKNDLPIGFVLSLPPENLVATFNSDGETGFNDAQTFEKAFRLLKRISTSRDGQLQSPDELLERTHTTHLPFHNYNELILTGNIPTTHTQISVNAVVIPCNQDEVLGSLSPPDFSIELARCLGMSDPNLISLLTRLKEKHFSVIGLKLDYWGRSDWIGN